MQECNNTRLEIAGAGFVTDGLPNLRYDAQSVCTQRVSALSTHGRRGDGDAVSHHFTGRGSAVGAAGTRLVGARLSAAKDRDTEDKTTSDEVETSVGASSCPTTAIAASACRGSARRARRASSSRATVSMSAACSTPCGCRAIRSPSSPAQQASAARFFGIDFDLWAEGYYYPAEAPPPGSGATNYWQANLKGSHKFDGFELIGQLGYSPTVWNSGASGVYGSGVLNIDMPTFKLPSRRHHMEARRRARLPGLRHDVARHAAPRLRPLAARHRVHARQLEPRSELPGHQSEQGELLRPHRRHLVRGMAGSGERYRHAGASSRIPTACAPISAAAPSSACCRSNSARRSGRPRVQPNVVIPGRASARTRNPGGGGYDDDERRLGFRVPPAAAPE